MYPELILVIAIIIFLFIYNKVISVKGALDANNSAIKYLKESDYDFLLIAKYGDLVYAPNEVFMKRIKQGLTWGILAFFVATLTGKMTFITFIICIAVGYIAFKKQYLDLKSFYKSHLNQIDSLLPYYLKGLEELPNFRKLHVNILSKEVEFDGEMYLLLVFNGATAGNFNLATRADACDGLLDIIMFKAVQIYELLPLFIKVLKGEHLDSNKVLYFKTDYLKVECHEDIVTDIDGEKGPDFPLEIKCIKGGLKILGAK